MKSKKKYEIKLNYSGEVYCYYRFAYSEDGALNAGIRALEKELNLRPGALTCNFKSGRPNYEVREVQK